MTYYLLQWLEHTRFGCIFSRTRNGSKIGTCSFTMDPTLKEPLVFTFTFSKAWMRMLQTGLGVCSSVAGFSQCMFAFQSPLGGNVRALRRKWTGGEPEQQLSAQSSVRAAVRRLTGLVKLHLKAVSHFELRHNKHL